MSSTINRLGGTLKGNTQAWTNKSVLAFAAGRDPVQAIVEAAREVALGAIDEGWTGPPFDPIKLAQIRGIATSPRADIPDARIVPVAAGRFLVEYNPTRPTGRLRYSIAHEIAHTLFSDCGERIRNRTKHTGSRDEWQLETLCNIAAAEILMPVGSMKFEDVEFLDIDHVGKARKQFDVSMEAILIRLVHLSEAPCAVFVASRVVDIIEAPTYTFDYVIPSRTWQYHIDRGATVPDMSPVPECTAVGFTAKGVLSFPDIPEKLRMECTGIPPYPGAIFPRVAGFLSSRQRSTSATGITYLRGNVLDPRGGGRKLIGHVVSDATPNWGGHGVAIALKRKWPTAQAHFRDWASNRRRPRLGEVHFCEVDPQIEVASMVCQHGYGESNKPRIRYTALEAGLRTLSNHAKQTESTVHIPRIGCGQAGGSWMLVEELIVSTLSSAGIAVTVYDLPNRNASPGAAQLSLAPIS